MKFNIGDEVLVHERLRAIVKRSMVAKLDNVLRYYVEYCDGSGADYHVEESLTLAPVKQA